MTARRRTACGSVAGGKFQRRGGLRGGQTATRAVSPDVAIVLIPPAGRKTLIMAQLTIARLERADAGVKRQVTDCAAKTYRWIETVAAEIGVPLQSDMFSKAARTVGRCT